MPASPIDHRAPGVMPGRASIPLPSGQWLAGTDGHRWWFDSGSIALDFAYTGALSTDPPTSPSPGTAWETLHTPAELSSWLDGRFGGIISPADARELTDALALRAIIAGLARAAASGTALDPRDIDIVNLYAATPDIPPTLPGGSRQAGRSRVRATQALSTIARETARVFSGEAGGRVRQCGAADCSILYVDTSRSGNRRWCSMQRCGNRAKVRAHRARQATAPSD